MTTDAEALVIAIEDDPDPDELASLDDRLAAYTVDATGWGDAQPLAVLVRDRDRQVVAGVHGWTWGRCCELVTLWVDEDARGRGIGSRLLAVAERTAQERGCAQVVLFTHEVHAPGLYVGHGYEMVGQVDDYPAGSVAYWMRKSLTTG